MGTGAIFLRYQQVTNAHAGFYVRMPRELTERLPKFDLRIRKTSIKIY
jgi:hypothetical protein